MPFVNVSGLPDSYQNRDFLLSLRRQIVEAVVKSMHVSPSWVRVFFPTDLLDLPRFEEDGCQTVYVTLETAMFAGVNDSEKDKLALAVVTEIAKTIWFCLDGDYEVEVFVLNLSPKHKIIIHSQI